MEDVLGDLYMTKDKDNSGGSNSMLHISRDGNGGITLSIPLALISIFIMALIALVPAVMAYGALEQRVDNLEGDWQEAAPRHTKIIEDIDSRLDSLDKIAAGTEVSLKAIQEDIREIKTDLKDVKNNLDTRSEEGI